ncbi:MAG: DUF362 domain-containing protein [Clostridia bacterium]|nr:DUF362 domain-containing protein [Clostridia bacterium]
MSEVNIVKCEDYSDANVKKAFDELIPLIGGLDWVKPGMKIMIKANLVTFLKPEAAATTHPSLLCELVKRLVEKGAEVVVGDSPGGMYNSIYVNRVYSATRIDDVKKFGGKLNENFGQSIAKFDEGKILKEFPYTSYLDDADVIINFCKLKSHGMMGMSAAVKNLFGIIPGTKKPEFHYRYPNHNDFANMLIDLNEFLKPKLCIVDAVVGMEGNGPTAGTPRQVGAILASENPYKLDLACSTIMGLKIDDVPTLSESFKRGYIPESIEKVDLNDDLNKYFVKDYDNVLTHRTLKFENQNTIFGRVSTKLLKAKPNLKSDECVGCGKCAEVCPVKAIEIVKGKAKIDRKKCIKCFCCQEFCPKGAMKVKRTLVAKLLTK